MSAALRKHIELSGLVDKMPLLLDKADSGVQKDRRNALLEIRQTIHDTPLAARLIDEIERHFQTLDADRVAVRSSALAEDLAGHSFAGQYKTFLGIRNLPECIDSLKKCWASLWAERAYEYRKHAGYGHDTPSMAVIVQLLIEADTSGVIFTADPLSGYGSRIVIEAVSGMGDSLVGGKVTPDRFIIRKHNLRIISRRIRNGKVDYVFDKDGSARRDAKEDCETADPCIGLGTARSLAKLARKVELKFGCPQDIEWAIRDDKEYVLQTRPITVVPEEKSWEQRQVWTNANIGEVFPDAITPMTWSAIELMFNPLFESAFRLLGAELGRNPLAGLVASRVYFNINTMIGVAQYFPQKWSLSLHEGFGGEHAKVFELGEVDIADEDVPDLGFSCAKMTMRLPLSICEVIGHNQKKAMRVAEELASSSRRLRALDLGDMSSEELAHHFVTAIENTLGHCNILPVLIGSLSFPILRALCARWLNDQNGTIANRLLGGLTGMDDAQAGLDLWNLAASTRESPEVEDAILSGDDWGTVQKMIRNTEAGRAFLRQWKAFMTRHGHHCQGEMEVFNARWSEKPDYILSILRKYLDSMGEIDPVKDYRDRSIRREEVSRECRQQLRSPIRRLIFSRILRRAQRGVVLRENWKSEAVRYVAAFRHVLLELGQRLEENGVLGNRDDIFFLRLDEITSVTKKSLRFDVRTEIASRQAEYERGKGLVPPAVVIGKYNPDEHVLRAAEKHARVLKGLAVSSGVVTGKARVMLRADGEQQLLPGEILVAPFTDPGWTPHFLLAAAIVMELGGMLSHGSIIAREYGIPSVVNVGAATKIIRTGQTIEVDADNGVVRILGVCRQGC